MQLVGGTGREQFTQLGMDGLVAFFLGAVGDKEFCGRVTGQGHIPLLQAVVQLRGQAKSDSPHRQIVPDNSCLMGRFKPVCTGLLGV